MLEHIRHLPAAVPQDTWSQHKDFLTGFPVQEEESVQIGRGKAVYRTAHALGRDCLVGYVNVAPKIVVNLVLTDGWLNTLIPLPGMEEVKCNGVEVLSSSLTLMASRNGYSTVGQGRNNLFFTVRISKLQNAIAALAGAHPEDFSIKDLSARLPDHAMVALQRALLETLSTAAPTSNSDEQRTIAPARETHLISVLASVLLPSLLKENRVGSTLHVSPREIVRAAESAWEEGGSPPSIADMCFASGVSERHLRNCFIDTYGVSPARYSKLRRLSAARRRLLGQNAGIRSVKEIALALGFCESGRFAADYHSLFDEYPSQTLNFGSSSQSI